MTQPSGSQSISRSAGSGALIESTTQGALRSLSGSTRTPFIPHPNTNAVDAGSPYWDAVLSSRPRPLAANVGTMGIFFRHMPAAA
ncbi:hypothetical protein RSAG8_14009, partial [Rhizoctonia solani AG-8 WAC10335]